MEKMEVREVQYISEALCRVLAMDLRSFTFRSGSMSQTFKASMNASRTPLDGSEAMYSAGLRRC